MNIFYLDRDPAKAARLLCDKHVVKMILESCQMLATAHHLLGSTATYKATHKNHPSAKWVRESKENYDWLWSHAMYIGWEYNRRYRKIHKCLDYILGELKTIPPELKDGPFTNPPQCMPDEYKDPNTVFAYRNYYVYDKLINKGMVYKDGMPEIFSSRIKLINNE
jgi:hypothetical protein